MQEDSELMTRPSLFREDHVPFIYGVSYGPLALPPIAVVAACVQI